MAVVGAIHGPSRSLSIRIKLAIRINLASIVESKSDTPDRWREGGCPFGKSLAMTGRMGDI